LKRSVDDIGYRVIHRKGNVESQTATYDLGIIEDSKFGLMLFQSIPKKIEGLKTHPFTYFSGRMRAHSTRAWLAVCD
jgi:hypothetical protein